MKLRTIALAALYLPWVAFASPISGIDQANFDVSVRPQDNLFLSVNGAWLKQATIPADRSSWGAFDVLEQRSEDRLKDIAEHAGEQSDAESRLIHALYQSFMNEAAIEAAGSAPVQPWLKQVDAIGTKTDLSIFLGSLMPMPVSLPFALGVGQDPKQATQYLTGADQSGLGLPDRDYYLKKDASYAKIRTAYLSHLTTLFTLSGDTQAQATARSARVLAFETKLAHAQWDRVSLRNPQKTYNKMSITQLQALAPALNWSLILQHAELQNAKEINIGQPTYFKALSALVNSTPIPVWQDYLRARVLDGAAPYLNKAFANASFEFKGKTLAGQKEEKARWKRAISFVEGSAGEALGSRYVAKYFPPEHKARMETLVANLMKAYSSSIDGLTWMSSDTKAKAHEKLDHYMVKIGYPSKWRDYSALEAKADDLFGNAIRGAQFAWRFNIGHLGKTVDRTEWGMTPQTVNAYYNPSLNEIVFPAAILQPPFFNPEAEDAVNYGGIGAVIGHEISHGFDDQGAQFDAYGNLKNWWTAADKKAFDALTTRLVKQYDAYEPLPGKHINGKLTLGENIADLSGLQIAYKGYQLSLNGQPAPVLDGFTGEQRFFLGFSQVWRGKMQDELLLNLLTTNPHSPEAFRVIGASVNSDAFQSAFAVKPGDKMYKAPSERIRIW
ncbi:M13 family metallopeptidase [Burkholderiaceae bacterium DAT-1]|nr:M13 family metallopeptidase [Burkholderiaceae bacterium DAT-1]